MSTFDSQPVPFQGELPEGKPPHSVFPALMAFSPNRETLGGTAYFLATAAGNILVDCPPWTQATQAFLSDRPVRWLFITQRQAIAQVKPLQQRLHCEIVIQEQEAYLLPNLDKTTFRDELVLSEELTALWTSGFSPGSACLHWRGQGGLLFTGRHLLPTRQGALAPLRSAKTFHWPRQLRSVERLRDRFSPDTLRYICPGASIGYLRGKYAMDDAYSLLRAIDLDGLQGAEVGF